MKFRILQIWLAAFAATTAASWVQAQSGEAAVDACRSYAKRELARSGTAFRDLVLDRDDALLEQQYRRKLGGQSVSSVLSGRGAIVLEGAPSVELDFVCLLASERRALFFHWTPRSDAGAMRRCSRGAASAASAAALRTCVAALLELEEMGLTRISALRFQESLDADTTVGNEDASNAYRVAASAWRAYRDAECARRMRVIQPASEADLVRASCMAELTRKRYQDLREAR
jgi:hypothetical protein